MSVSTTIRPIDFDHLSHHAGGDTALMAEVLSLFAGQAEQLVARLRIQLDRGDTKAWRDTMHSLKGAARSVGAFPLADAAALGERLDPIAHGADASALIDRLRAMAVAVRASIRADATA